MTAITTNVVRRRAAPQPTSHILNNGSAQDRARTCVFSRADHKCPGENEHEAHTRSSSQHFSASPYRRPLRPRRSTRASPRRTSRRRPGAQDKAAKKCKAERASDAAAFRARYGSNGLGKCITGQKAKSKDQKAEDDDEADKKAEENAAKKCKAEREKLGVQAFKDSYGTNANKANAFGKCVSKLAKQQGSTS